MSRLMFGFVGVTLWLWLWDGHHRQVDSPTEPADLLQDEWTLYLLIKAMEVQTDVRT